MFEQNLLSSFMHVHSVCKMLIDYNNKRKHDNVKYPGKNITKNVLN